MRTDNHASLHPGNSGRGEREPAARERTPADLLGTQQPHVRSSTPPQPRSSELKGLLAVLDGITGSWLQRDFRPTLRPAKFVQITSDLNRARRQFDSKLFFIVIFGPLKAGKSTLTNTLAGECVSPAGFGKETTRRPSLVMAAPESGIDQYFSNDPEVNHFLSQKRARAPLPHEVEGGGPICAKVREAFDAVADILRGVRSLEEFQAGIRKETLSLIPANLDRALTEDAATEPLMTVVRCKGGHLLGPGVAVVDMPGLDGNKSNWREDPIHEWVISRAEFFLFVQSSVAALNNQTHDFLKEIVALSTKPPIWLVQNLFDARHWLPFEQRERDEESQRGEGKRRITEILGEAPRAVMGLNVAMAWDGRDQENSAWLERSEFLKFEAGLSSVLHAERTHIQERNSLKYLKKAFERGSEQLDLMAQEIEAATRSRREKQEALKKVEGLLGGINYGTDWQKSGLSELKTLAEGQADLWKKAVKEELVNLGQRQSGQRRAGKDLNAAFQNTAARLGAEGGAHFGRSFLLPGYIALATKYVKSAECAALAEGNALLAALSLAPLTEPFPISVEDLPVVQTDPFSLEGEGLSFQERRAWGWKRKYDGTEVIKRVTNAGREWEREIDDRWATWARDLYNRHFTIYCERRREHYQQHAQRLMKDFSSQVAAAEQAGQASEAAIRAIRGDFAKLALALEQAFGAQK